MLISALRVFESAFDGRDNRRVQVRQKRQRTSVQFVDLTPGSWKVSKVAALSSKKSIFVLVLRECRALTRSFLPFKIQKPSKTAGIRPAPAAMLKRLITVFRVSSGTRVNGQISGLPVVPLMPYQQSTKNLLPPWLVEPKGHALAPSGSSREVGLKE